MQGLLFNDDEVRSAAEKQHRSSSEELHQLFSTAKECQNCTLGSTRINFVFGEGNPSAELVVIGEAPGAEEDASGRPFVGRSGQLLDKILLAAGFSREEVYICNVIKCRPPGNRNPLQNETRECMPILLRQLRIIKPRIILILGKVAANTIFENNLSLGAMRGKVQKWQKYDCFITYHPAALLRNPHWKRGCLEDIQMMMRHYASECGKEMLHENRIER